MRGEETKGVGFGVSVCVCVCKYVCMRVFLSSPRCAPPHLAEALGAEERVVHPNHLCALLVHLRFYVCV